MFDQLRVAIVYVLPTSRKTILVKIMIVIVDGVAIRCLSTKVTDALH